MFLMVLIPSPPLHSREEAFISALYENRPLQCHSCGLRFAADEQQALDNHKDWHFRVNKKLRESNNAQCRAWFLQRDDWIIATDEGTSAARFEAEAEAAAAAAGGANAAGGAESSSGGVVGGSRGALLGDAALVRGWGWGGGWNCLLVRICLAGFESLTSSSCSPSNWTAHRAAWPFAASAISAACAENSLSHSTTTTKVGEVGRVSTITRF